jgi:small GTP-binding protein
MGTKPTLLQRRIAICGDVSAGKTALFDSFQSKPFNEASAPTRIAAYAVISGSESTPELNIWDTTGDPTQRHAIGIYARKVDVVLICTDSLMGNGPDVVRRWYSEVESVNVGELRPTFAIIRTKADLGCAPAEDQALQRLTARYGCEGFIVSAKSGTGIRELMEKLPMYCSERMRNIPPTVNIADAAGSGGCKC